ncbi:unnamed protein product [Toxocara canis]|uniref:Uncharacterized protein n=1 Tax=Toxocara canis TaxID=6265 RepID=A0A183UQ56_TOXCA|nr:unnamed protein product [Toxocara canis]
MGQKFDEIDPTGLLLDRGTPARKDRITSCAALARERITGIRTKKCNGGSLVNGNADEKQCCRGRERDAWRKAEVAVCHCRGACKSENGTDAKQTSDPCRTFLIK